VRVILGRAGLRRPGCSGASPTVVVARSNFEAVTGRNWTAVQVVLPIWARDSMTGKYADGAAPPIVRLVRALVVCGIGVVDAACGRGNEWRSAMRRREL
jgi:hypothetical protein